MTGINLPFLRESAIVSGSQAVKSFDDRGRQIATEQIKNLTYVKLPSNAGETVIDISFTQDVEVLSVAFTPYGGSSTLPEDNYFHTYENLFLPKEESLGLVYPSPSSTTFFGRLFLRRIALDLIAYR